MSCKVSFQYFHPKERVISFFFQMHKIVNATTGIFYSQPPSLLVYIGQRKMHQIRVATCGLLPHKTFSFVLCLLHLTHFSLHFLIEQILIPYFFTSRPPAKIMFFHLAFSVFLQPILHLNGLVDLNFKKALTAFREA